MLNTNKCSIQSIEVQFVKAAIIVISVHLKILALFVVSHAFWVLVSPLHKGRTQISGPRKRFPFPCVEVTDTKVMWTFFRDQILCPLIEVRGTHRRFLGYPEYSRSLEMHSKRCYGVFSHDVTAAILVSQNNETAAMLVSQTSPLGVELFSYANAFFCSNKFA